MLAVQDAQPHRTGVGDVRAEWMLVGEAPGAEEDAKASLCRTSRVC
jgi:uracil-DNA glycosylase